LIQAVLDMGRTALMMVPEISLTPQMVKKFKLYFGDDIALIHSSLSLGQRTDEFKRIRSGKAKIVIGTRSAVFAPLKNIGIIIMDEEGERTYKSDSPPRYHARDVAIQRCGHNNSVLLLASATPSIESFYYAKQGRFHLFEMKDRYANATLPAVEIIYMQSEAHSSNNSVFSRRLADAIEDKLNKKEQVILLLNRRGFTTYVSCVDCRQPVSCPNCSLPLTFHKKNGRLMCHYCGYSMSMPYKCPECGSTELKQSGVGTQRIEDELGKLYPKARLLRMDADTTFTRGAYEESFTAFEKGEYDIMLGTQMIAKGLNFPNVTLVGVVSVDKALFTGDFRSYERTFSLITQVAGRSGRGDKPGTALIQTFVPDHYVINLAAQQDYDEFYEQESELRKALLFPPFCDICAINFSSVMESRVIEGSRDFLQILKSYIGDNDVKIPLRVLGPSPCTLERINNRYRYRLIIKCRLSRELRKMVLSCLDAFHKLTKYAEVRVTADINGDIGL
ncbi:MAG: primosomal protein N', partial [Ruminococcus sp.]|nr:primosomal protein N' [Ruminococcus sp.]